MSRLLLSCDRTRTNPADSRPWRSGGRLIPPHLEKNSAEYRVIVRTDQGEDLAVQEVPHSARKGGEKCRFSDDDFSFLDEDALLSAKVAVEVVGNADIERQGERGFRHSFRRTSRTRDFWSRYDSSDTQ